MASFATFQQARSLPASIASELGFYARNFPLPRANELLRESCGKALATTQAAVKANLELMAEIATNMDEPAEVPDAQGRAISVTKKNALEGTKALAEKLEGFLA